MKSVQANPVVDITYHSNNQLVFCLIIVLVIYKDIHILTIITNPITIEFFLPILSNEFPTNGDTISEDVSNILEKKWFK